MGEFNQISTELLPFIGVEISFQLPFLITLYHSILSNFFGILFQTLYKS